MYLLLLLILFYVDGKPNIVIFIADDLGIADIGCFGNSSIKTPNIDYIAKNGMKLMHNLAAESICTPSRAALLTGRYALRLGFGAFEDDASRVILRSSSSSGLQPTQKTFGRVLKENNFTTGYFGKWHLGIHCCNNSDFSHFPLNHGFDYYYGLPLTNIQDCSDIDNGAYELVPRLPFPISRMFLPTICVTIFILVKSKFICKRYIVFLTATYFILWCLFILWCMIVRYTNCFVMRNHDVVEQPVDLSQFTSKLTKEVNGFIENSKRVPFLAVVAYHKVHSALKTHPNFVGHSKHGKYGDNVEELDYSVGLILDKLKELEVLDKTFIYFTSDHGPALYMIVNGEYHGGWKGSYRGGKSSSFEGGIRVPTVVMWPGKIPSNTQYAHPTSLLDVYPTLMSISNIPASSNQLLDGMDISHILRGFNVDPLPRFLYHYCGAKLEAVTYTTNDGNVWKLHYQIPKSYNESNFCDGLLCKCFGDSVLKLQSPELYNLVKDYSESNSISSKDENYSSVRSTIDKAVASHIDSIKHVERQLSKEKNRFSLDRQLWCNKPFCNF
ncbi:steryl-sulfatase isoform X1 [Hydra vulgaris]|uniref:steryl-sulfatase isoform X1 n=1 Tax=Hydra vulgaris TaxID=6087 RepID=UPI001F5FEE4A|nr:steryl-sulfatase [Hydra vulgaris]XP_047138717.1 steryl-sulfatase [Hydra vulgaris]XP_047138718.1 steryl-sulfatase [Hydra vulgaris]XP_047138719.1 steryl-sulfatase [Hydra vulgaris]